MLGLIAGKVEVPAHPPFRKERGRMGHPRQRLGKGGPPAQESNNALQVILYFTNPLLQAQGVGCKPE
jgi:hypothetical protein